MNTTLLKAFEEEFLSFFALYMMNLVFAAMTMAIGLAVVVQQLLPQPGALPAGVLSVPSPLSLVFGGLAFVLGLVWISATAKLLRSVKVVRAAYKQKKNRDMMPEDFTGMMVHMMTRYREQKRVIRAMVIICILGGCLMLVQGVLSAFLIAGKFSESATLTQFLIAIAGVAILLIMGGACILISTYFRRYAKVWDARLDALSRSEDELRQMLGQA
jgi:hypothetical protein